MFLFLKTQVHEVAKPYMAHITEAAKFLFCLFDVVHAAAENKQVMTAAKERQKLRTENKVP